MSKPQIVYIVSPRYSGSTLLSYLFSCHPSIATIGERKKFWVKSVAGPQPGDTEEANLCSCGMLFQQCPYWQEILKQFKSRVSGTELNLDFTQFKLFGNKRLNHLVCRFFEVQIARGNNWNWIPGASRLKRCCRLNQILIEVVLGLEGKTVFVDSSKPLRYAMMLSLIRDFEVKIVYLLRDPRAQVSSAVKYNPWPIPLAAKKLNDEFEWNERLLKACKIPQFALSYESLCLEPEQKMRELFAFCALPDAGHLDFRSTPQHIMGNMNMRMGSSSNIELRTDWKQRLTVGEQAAIEQQCVAMLKKIQFLTPSMDKIAS